MVDKKCIRYTVVHVIGFLYQAVYPGKSDSFETIPLVFCCTVVLPSESDICLQNSPVFKKHQLNERFLLL